MLLQQTLSCWYFLNRIEILYLFRDTGVRSGNFFRYIQYLEYKTICCAITAQSSRCTYKTCKKEIMGFHEGGLGDWWKIKSMCLICIHVVLAGERL